jgi:hypothetical protein
MAQEPAMKLEADLLTLHREAQAIPVTILRSIIEALIVNVQQLRHKSK